MPKLYRFVDRKETKTLDRCTFEIGPLDVEIYEFGDVESLIAFFNNPISEISPSYIVSENDDLPKREPGDHLVVRFGGKEYLTYITQDGVQRFIKNPDHFLLKTVTKQYGGNDLNDMAVRYQRNEFSQIDYAEMNMANGYSVSGFCDLSSFHDIQIESPNWRYTQPDDTFLFANMTHQCFHHGNGKITGPTAIKFFMEKDGSTEEEAIEYIDTYIGKSWRELREGEIDDY